LKAVTTFSKKGYKEYGERFLKSFVKHWPIPITVYFEEKPSFKHKKITYKPLNDIRLPIGNVKDYLEETKHLNGVNGSYDYNRDVSKFCRKVFAQYDNREEKFIWLDADCVTFKDVPMSFVEKLVEYPITYLGRKGFHTETGFIGFNKPENFFDEYVNLYLTGDIMRLPYWHDCGAFDHAREVTKTHGWNLSSDWDGKDLHVFVNSILGKYIDHCKGSRKRQGYSPEHPVKHW